MNDFIVEKKQELIILLQYGIRRLIFSHKLIFAFNNFFKIGKTLTVKGLAEYFKKLLYAVNFAFFRSSDRFNFLNIYWGIRLEREDF